MIDYIIFIIQSISIIYICEKIFELYVCIWLYSIVSDLIEFYLIWLDFIILCIISYILNIDKYIDLETRKP